MSGRTVPHTDFNPRSPCGERQELVRQFYAMRSISIHAPRAGSDPGIYRYQTAHNYFNPRSPCGERLLSQYGGLTIHLFQSTLPVRGATTRRVPRRLYRQYFNPRSPCGERRSFRASPVCLPKFQSTLPVRGATRRLLGPAHYIRISIHAPRAGSDWRVARDRSRAGHFNPRSPCGERRQMHRLTQQTVRISIHAPRAGSDFIM